MSKKRIEEVLSPEELAAARAGQAALHEFFQSRIGRQKDVAAASGIAASTLSSMARERAPITMEAAILIEVAAAGAVRAEVLCPSRANVIDKFLQLRAVSEAEA